MYNVLTTVIPFRCGKCGSYISLLEINEKEDKVTCANCHDSVSIASLKQMCISFVEGMLSKHSVVRFIKKLDGNAGIQIDLYVDPEIFATTEMEDDFDEIRKVDKIKEEEQKSIITRKPIIIPGRG